MHASLLGVFLLVQGMPGPDFQLHEANRLDLTANTASAMFGQSVALESSTLVVGAPQDGEAGSLAGAVLVYSQGGSQFEEKLMPATVDASDFFGCCIALDGDTLVAGARGDEGGGAAYVFRNLGAGFQLEAVLSVPGAPAGYGFGDAVALDGDRLVVGARFASTSQGVFSGSAHVFERSGSTWSAGIELLPTDVGTASFLGESVSIDGDRIVLGAGGANASGVSGAGAAYVYALEPEGWELLQKLENPVPSVLEDFGSSVALEGGVLAVGNSRELQSDGTVHVFERAQGLFVPAAILTPSEALPASSLFGERVAVAGGRVLVGAPSADAFGGDSGLAFLFQRFDGGWIEAARVEPTLPVPSGLFGTGLALDGSRVLVGAPGDELTTCVEFRSYLSFCEGSAAGCSTCPCGNDPRPGATGGCLHHLGGSATLRASGSASRSADDFALQVVGAPPRTSVMLRSGSEALPAAPGPCQGTGSILPSLDGLRCIGGAAVRHAQVTTDLAGGTEAIRDLVSAFQVGETRTFQAWFREPIGAQCGTGLGTTNAISVTVLP